MTEIHRSAAMLVLAGVLATPNASARKGTTAATDRLITNSAAGPYKLGITVAAARTVANQYKVVDAVGIDGVPALEVREGKSTLMLLYPATERLNPTTKIEVIDVHSPTFHTREGLRVGLSISAVEKILGPLLSISRSEIESIEVSTFEREPTSGVTIQVMGRNEYAGVYAEGASTTKRYHPSATIHRLTVTKPPRQPADLN